MAPYIKYGQAAPDVSRETLSAIAAHSPGSPRGRRCPTRQTVYDASLPTPKWFGQGVTYQIFPDRFRRTGTPSVEGLVGSRVLHQSWDEPVELNEDQGDDQGRDFFGGTLAGIEEKLEYSKWRNWK